MLAIINSCGVLGMDGFRISVEADVSSGLPAFEIVGLPDATVKESKERVRAAIRNSGFEFPLRRITVNLAPADVRKEGASLDLPIALAILCATGQVDANLVADAAFVGELSLEGVLRPINGALAMADSLSRIEGIERLFLPEENAAEAALVGSPAAYPLACLKELVYGLQGVDALPQAMARQTAADMPAEESIPDMAEVRGQEGVKRALEVAAAGGHNLLMVGSPGSGKTMLAKRMPGIMPPLSFAESMEVTRLYSIAGLLPRGGGLVGQRPYRAPHHGASAASLVGGGANPRPGEISLAHRGVLFLDELPEFHRDVLESLRQPLEDGRVVVARVNSRVEFPAQFQLIAALNPCPCGYYGDTLKPCHCTPLQRQRYLQKISGPLLDRIDIQIEVPRVRYDQLKNRRGEETSHSIRQRVIAAREVQARRFADRPGMINALMSHADTEKYCIMDEAAQELLAESFRLLQMSARAHDRILKVARTIADLGGAEVIGVEHIAEAIQYRNLDREQF
ncbi:MAG: YifB family Mg chelatase-like AAA ATPase [Firmicutes bacterium]|nr:YifB family Mg chelatase-like AAA ATPase [Bacillota bacterium]